MEENAAAHEILCPIVYMHTYLLLSLPVEGAELPFQQMVESEEISHLTTAIQETAEGGDSLVRDVGTCKDTGIRLLSTLQEALIPCEGGWSNIQPTPKLVDTALYVIPE